MSYTRITPGEAIPAYLNRTKHLHNGLGWSALSKRLELGATKKKIAEDFGVSRVTVYTWLKLIKGNSGTST